MGGNTDEREGWRKAAGVESPAGTEGWRVSVEMEGVGEVGEMEVQVIGWRSRLKWRGLVRLERWRYM